MLVRFVGQNNKLWNIGRRHYCGSHLIKHNDPPRSQAPDIFEAEYESDFTPDHYDIDKEKYQVRAGRLKEIPSPKIIVTNDDYEMPSLFLRSIDRIRTWYFGVIDVVANYDVVWQINKEKSATESRTPEEGKLIREINHDAFQAVQFVFAAVFFPPVALIMLLFSVYNPYGKPSTFHNPRDIASKTKNYILLIKN